MTTSISSEALKNYIKDTPMENEKIEINKINQETFNLILIFL